MQKTLAVAPKNASPEIFEAVSAAGFHLVDPAEAEVLIWAGHASGGFKEFLGSASRAKWVQLGTAGVEWIFQDNLYTGDLVWTCAKGDVYSDNVAELALLLLLAGYRDFKRFVSATEWLPPAGRPVRGMRVCVIGGGGIARALIRPLNALGASTVIVKRSEGGAMEGAAEVVTLSELERVLATSDAVVLAAPLTAESRHLMNEKTLSVMKPGAWLINVARGGLVDTDALVAALESGRLGGAALDVTEPEPLPAGHPLWTSPRVIITPHVANTEEMSPSAFASRVEENLRRWARGDELLGRVDVVAGY